MDAKCISRRTTCWLILAAAMTAGATAAEPAAEALLDPDVVADFGEPDSLVVSPDGQWIAYISKGAVWRSSVGGGPPTRLAELPDTITARLDTPEYRNARGDFDKLGSRVSFATFSDPRRQRGLARAFSLKWTLSQDGVCYTLAEYLGVRPWTATYRVLHASTQGEVTLLTTVTRNAYEKPHILTSFDVTADRSLVVTATEYGTPLLWDAKSDRPRATCFDYLVPSSTSGRFLGIEIDTRQLVITDPHLKVVKRLDAAFPERRRCDIVWSPDERFAICCCQSPHPAQDWEGFRIDLETGHRRPLAGLYWSDRFEFTGRGGEAVTTGNTIVMRGDMADGSSGTYLTLVPDGDAPARDLCRFPRPPRRTGDWRARKRYPPVRISRDGALFAMALPRADGRAGFRYWLVDRDGNYWPFGPDDPTLFASPYHVVSFADHGRRVIACDDVRLFSVSVAAIQAAKEAGDE